MAEGIPVNEATCKARMNDLHGDIVEIKLTLTEVKQMLNPKMETLLLLEQKVKLQEAEIERLKKRPLNTFQLILSILGSPVLIALMYAVLKLMQAKG